MLLQNIKSPYNLIQEDYIGDTWRICTIAILLRQVPEWQARDCIKNLFEKYKTPSSLANENIFNIQDDIKITSMYKKKASKIKILARRIEIGDSNGVDELPYVQGHVLENYKLFVLGELIDTKNQILKKYVEWAKEYLKNSQL